LKRIYKRICKNKTCGASMVQNVKNKETIHAYLMKIFIGSILSNLCTYIMRTSSIMHFYTCFGLYCPTQIIGLTSLLKSISFTGAKGSQ
jgi:hypothetical protein